MKKDFNLGRIELCLKINKKLLKKDIKIEFIEQLKIKDFHILKNCKVESKIKKEEVCYVIDAENGSFMIFSDIPFHAHLIFYLDDEIEFKGFAELITTICKSLIKINEQKIIPIEFVMAMDYKINKNIKLEKFVILKDIDKIKKENGYNEIEVEGIELGLEDNENRAYVIKISKYQNEITANIGGKLISKKEKGGFDIFKLYKMLNEKINKLLTIINNME